MDNSYRIKANIGTDQVLNVSLKQDIDIYEVLSLKLKQENLYKLHSADYGVIVGRVLANDAFGVQNVKVTVFIPLSDTDKLIQSIRSIYPYSFVTDTDNRNVKFNVLPNYKKFACHQEVGSFPKKQLVLDDDTVLEIYDKYYKYSTVTNKAGDYMIFGVPTGEQILHVDVDLSDIGILSQEPRDFIYKGYSIDLFESPTQFKKSTNLDSLPQIQNQNVSLNVYPLWGDKTTNNIAITRKDINLQYKFETTCVFLGSVITDSGPNSIGHNCIPDANVGEAGQLSPSKGNIEMIRKTVNDKIEEYPIKGNQLIDSDGTWCYQIPMNLDYVGMDEYGNIVPTNNTLKGIPTRARVRFRITLDEAGDDNLTRHKARYLIPNNPDLYEGYCEPHIHEKIINNDSYYEFGTLTPDDCFRDLYWNKVYSVKNYIPRIQMSKHEKSVNYLAIKGVNKKDAMKNNPLPYNKLNANFSIPAYYLLHTYGKGNYGVSGFWRFLRSNSIPYSTDSVREAILEELDAIGLDFYNDWLNGCLYFPSWLWRIRQKKKHKKGESLYESVFCECKNKDDDNLPGNLYIYNNCSIAYENDDMVIKTVNEKEGGYLYNSFYEMYTSIPLGSKKFYSGVIKKKKNKDGAEAFYYSFGNKIENEKVDGNKDFDSIFPDEFTPAEGKHYYKYARLFSTDIILLGSLKDCDFDAIPKVAYTIPSTTSNIPPMGRHKYQTEEIDEEAKENLPSYDSDDEENELVTHNGMNWGGYWYDETKRRIKWYLKGNDEYENRLQQEYKYRLGSGLFFGLTYHKVYHGTDWATAGLILAFGAFVGSILNSFFGAGEHVARTDIVPRTDLKTCVNLERISELGVALDSEVNIEYDNIDGSAGYSYVSEMDGLITKREIEDVDTRALFATLNSTKLIGTVENYVTGYKKYNLRYFYPTNFDGRMGDKIKQVFDGDWVEGKSIAEFYTNGVTGDDRNKDYLDFRFGNVDEKYITSYRNVSISPTGKVVYVQPSRTTTETVVNNPNSDYYTEYVISDGYDISVMFNKPKIRHFYGYKNGVDNPYPTLLFSSVLDDYPFSFPLYDNSFYFYFGLNQGSTAIDKFYEQFYSNCYEEKTEPFIVNITTQSAVACDESSGNIHLNIQEISTPFIVQIYSNGMLIHDKKDISTYDVDFNGLRNGEYEVVVIDSNGNETREKVLLEYQKISLDVEVERCILTEYIDQTCKDICENDYYGKLRVSKFTAYGITTDITNLERKGDGKYKLNSNIESLNIVMEIKPNDGDSFSNYVCGGENCTGTEIDNNVINISKPGTFTIKVYEMCKDKISDNISYYAITVSDSKRLEMYLNGVPLKYLVGYNEELIPYNKWFHGKGEQVVRIEDDSIKGWFGVHNPLSYDKLFQNPFEDDKSAAIWLNDIGSIGSLEVIHEKFDIMFNLSKSTYVTAGSKNSFTVRADGGEGEILIRSAAPDYDKFSHFNTEYAKNFLSYLTNEKKSVTCNEFNPNIVSENYRYVTDDEGRFTIDGNGVVNGEEPIITMPYDFNPKYNNAVNKAANYFAAFSNNANIVQTGQDECVQKTNYKPYQVIPYKANDLYTDGMCLYSEKNDILTNVYITNNTYKTHRYFRTEFIDRRFDYNMFFITGHKGNHFDIKKEEKDVITTETIWDKGRISALTYNGIEMLYDDSKNKSIISEDNKNNPNTEYTYDVTSGVVNLDLSQPKRFYESRLYCGTDKYIDLREAYQSKVRQHPQAFYLETSGTNMKIECIRNNNDFNNDAFENFGFNGEHVMGYPTKRWLDYYKIPYGDSYTFTNVSCSYDGINVKQTDKEINAIAVPGEIVSFSVEACELVKLNCIDFEVNCKNDHYNVKFSGAKEGHLDPIYINDLPFRIESTGSDGFRSKITSIKICYDVDDHSNLSKIKSASSLTDCINLVEEYTVKDVENEKKDFFDTSEEFKNHIFQGGEIRWDKNYAFINVIFDRLYYSQAFDSLMKRIRVLNTSTIYNVSGFGFGYIKHNIVTSTSVIPANSIFVESEGSGNLPDNENNSNGGTVNVESEGQNTNDVSVIRSYDYTEFKFSNSPFIANKLGRICFKIEYGGDTVHYTLDAPNVGIVQKTDDSITFGVIWEHHRHLLEEMATPHAVVMVNMEIKNNIKSDVGEGHLEFAFGFKIDAGSAQPNICCNYDEF